MCVQYKLNSVNYIINLCILSIFITIPRLNSTIIFLCYIMKSAIYDVIFAG